MARPLFTLVTAAALALLVVTACTSDNEEDSLPQPTPQPQQCDVSNVTFSKTITPILSANCYTCHSSSFSEGGVVLDTHAGVKKQADNGTLLGVITHASGFPAMPQGAAKLSDCNIARIKKWIEAGAPDN
ncbi:cytochrome c [Pontibacter ummariensis]|uniref:Planctomycete cytochrome C n=1 Tax=Pontibacter ummariensis TaxID=1610492 RepID=A0A239JWL6_9BACT|nr:c-type cytochrome domain-containing protein [Pontibacter ummariensis]PRY07291.1 cytochrome c [Pontibacter ummariensis]SNT10327.1 Planctomycete cytochrome C [Pontibacter ummariensis]